jgi:hypothetical protein
MPRYEVNKSNKCGVFPMTVPDPGRLLPQRKLPGGAASNDQ